MVRMKKIVNSDVLKIIGMATMLIDHCAIVFFSLGLPEWAYWIMRGIGRLSFPIFAYFIVQGFIYTRSVAKYEARLLGTGLISEIPYNIAIFGKLWYFKYNNILFTFALALFVLWASKKLYEKNTGYIPFAVIITLWAMAVSYVLGLDYSWKCILLILIFYYARSHQAIMYTASGIVMAAGGSVIGIAAPLSLIPIHMHNGDKGRMPRCVPYIFYPAHLLVLGLIRMFIQIF